MNEYIVDSLCFVSFCLVDRVSRENGRIMEGLGLGEGWWYCPALGWCPDLGDGQWGVAAASIFYYVFICEEISILSAFWVGFFFFLNITWSVLLIINSDFILTLVLRYILALVLGLCNLCLFSLTSLNCNCSLLVRVCSL